MHTPGMRLARGVTGATLLLVLGGALLVFLALPPVGLLVATGASGLLAGFSHPSVGPALRLSAFTTMTSLALDRKSVV